MKVIKLNESVLQDLKRDHENVRKEYGEEVYNALNDYIKQGIDLGNVLYNKGEWDKFIKWAQDKGVKVEQPINTIDEDLSTDTFEIYGDEETLRQLEKDLQESINEDVPMEYVDGDTIKALADEDEYYNKQRARRIHNIELLHKIFDNHGYRDSEDYWADKVHSIFYNAEKITVVDDASKVPDRTNDGQKIKYVISTPDAEVDVHVDAYGDYVWVVTKDIISESIDEDLSGEYSDKFRELIRKYTDSALIVGLVDDIIRYSKEDDLKDLYFERDYNKLIIDESILESIDEKDILHKLDQFTSKITINKDDEKALKDILLKKNVSFKIDDSKADKLTFKLNYKKLNENLSENGQTVQRYIDSEIPDILISLSDKLPNMYSSDIDVLVKSCKSFYDLCESLVMYYNRHTKIEEDLTDVATATLEGPQEGAQFGLAGLVNEAIQKELATVDEYNTLAINARSEGFEDIVNVINEINTEENKHIGQLQELLKTLSPNAEAIDVGKVEGEQQLEEEVNKDTESPNTNDNILVEEDDNVDWKPIYDKFKQIEKDLNNDGEAVTAVIDKMYLDNKDDPAYVKAFQVWSEQ